MPRVSRQVLGKTIWDKIQANLIEVLATFDEEAFVEFLPEFLTKEEMAMISKRLALYLMLMGGYSDTEIKEFLMVSYETIRTSRNSLGAKNPRFKEILRHWIEKPVRSKEPSGFLKMVELALEAKSSRKSRAKLLSGDY
ncbi:MAG: Trp family transcriptional regulator [Candidatus Woykebacteria bacterium]